MGFVERLRPLRGPELALARTVFQGFLPYDDVLIGDHTGLQGAPWTQWASFNKAMTEKYILHLGLAGFADASSSATTSYGVIRETFIHELTHVWQGSHSFIHGLYQARSLACQAWALITTFDRDNAYQYAAGAEWSSYNVEQQASIVEDWFSNGSRTSDPLYRYISQNIRR
jgi:hypothetical protein